MDIKIVRKVDPKRLEKLANEYLYSGAFSSTLRNGFEREIKTVAVWVIAPDTVSHPSFEPCDIEALNKFIDAEEDAWADDQTFPE